MSFLYGGIYQKFEIFSLDILFKSGEWSRQAIDY